MTRRIEIEVDGRVLSLETGKFAKQADGAVMVRYADTMVLATVVSAKEPVEDQDFVPLQVEYREKTSAAGRIPGGFFKREGRPTEKEILSSRLIDRPIRPLFPKNYRYETQVLVTVFSSDQEHDADVLGAIGASAALLISDIPFDGPIAEVRIGRIDGGHVINPTLSQLEKSDMDLVVAGSAESVIMVEGEARETSEEGLLEAMRVAHEAIKRIIDAQLEFAQGIAKQKRQIDASNADDAILADVSAHAKQRIQDLNRAILSKDERSKRRENIETEVKGLLVEKYPEKEALVSQALHDLEREDMRSMILSEGRRLDGRSLAEIRPITCEVGLLPRTHGSSLFTRGETQSLTTVTLGTKPDEQLIEGLFPESTKRFMLHYNFPPFSVGEVGRVGGPGRREIGHGNLAERALKNLIPSETEFPYTIRVVSDILESNGSSSMATVCAGSLALMDGGVPIPKAVAGIAMGLVKEGDRVAVLSDILGNEDHFGDMDFKVAGTRDGITGFQMDIKIKGISFEILDRALQQAREGRLQILETMNQAISEPRKELSSYAPRLTSLKIPVDMIGAVIGPGGKTIRHIVQESGAEVNIEEDGTVVIASVNKQSTDRAREMIERITEVPEVGKVYKATVRKIMDFGAFCEFLPGKEGLLHISQIDTHRINKVSDVLKVGDVLDVRLVKIDEEGRFNLSRKVLLGPTHEKKEKREVVM